MKTMNITIMGKWEPGHVLIASEIEGLFELKPMGENSNAKRVESTPSSVAIAQNGSTPSALPGFTPDMLSQIGG